MRRALVGSLGLLLGVASLSFNAGREIQIPVGGARGPLMVSGLGPSSAVWSLPDAEVKDSRRDFYFRQLEASDAERPEVRRSRRIGRHREHPADQQAERGSRSERC